MIKASLSSFNKVIREKTEISFQDWNFDEVELNNYVANKLNQLPLMSENNVLEIDYQIHAMIISGFKAFVKVRNLTVRNSNEVELEKQKR